ncbi:MAG: hypothetical protein ACJ790_10575 [Myxococcaceae bacterium]
MRHLAPIFCTLSIAMLGCPGSLENPERFLDGGTDAGSSGGYVCPSANLKVKTALINVKCGNAGCHDANTQSGGLDLASANAPERLVNIPSAGCAGKTLVTADGGFLIEKIHPSPQCGVQMPSGSSLSATEQQCLVEWAAHISSGGAE